MVFYLPAKRAAGVTLHGNRGSAGAEYSELPAHRQLQTSKPVKSTGDGQAEKGYVTGTSRQDSGPRGREGPQGIIEMKDQPVKVTGS
jgi:hypothetical protein